MGLVGIQGSWTSYHARSKEPPFYRRNNSVTPVLALLIESDDVGCYGRSDDAADTATPCGTHVKVFERRRRKDVHHLDDVFVIEVPEQPDFPHNTLRVHEVFECSRNLFDRYLHGHKLRSWR